MTLVLLHCALASTETSVWKVRKDDSVFYLGGTFHLLRPSDFPLPPEFEKAYRKSDIIVIETDIDKFYDPSVHEKLNSKAKYADGSTIDNYLSVRTYDMLREYCDANEISLDRLKKDKPSIIAAVIAVKALGKLGAFQDGVESYFYNRAKKDRKPIETLETVMQQIDYIVSMGQGYEDVFISHTLQDMKHTEKQYANLVSAWKKGDADTLTELMITNLRKKTPQVYKQLIKERNAHWLPIIEAYYQTCRKAFILVGVGHLVGPDGLLEALKRKGCKIEKP